MKKISWVLEFLAIYALSLIVNLFPFSSLDRIAALLVSVLYPIATKPKRRIRDNLQYAFPDKNEVEIEILVRSNLRHVVRVSLEVMQARKFRKENFLKKYMRAATPKDENYYNDRDNGIVCVQGHLGSWELPMAFYAHKGVDISISVKKLANPLTNWLLEKWRKNYGVNCILVNESKKLVRALKKKHVIGLAADQDAGRDGIFVDFLGRKASTFPGPGILTYLTGAKLTLLTCLFQGKGVYQLEVKTIVEDFQRGDSKGRNQAILEITQKWTYALEQEILKNPEQYFWIHRRWKTRPP